MAYFRILFSTFRVNRGKLLPVEGDTLDRAMLSSDKCYLLDCYSKLYLWMGKTTPSSEKKASITSVEVSFNNPMISILASMPRFRLPLCVTIISMLLNVAVVVVQNLIIIITAKSHRWINKYAK